MSYLNYTMDLSVFSHPFVSFDNHVIVLFCFRQICIFFHRYFKEGWMARWISFGDGMIIKEDLVM